MIIDFHTHTFPDKIAAFAVNKLKHASKTVAFSDGTASGLCAGMKKAGVDRAVVLPVVTNPAKTASMNSVSIEKTGCDGLIYFGGIHPDTPDAYGELRRLARAGIAGVKIHPVYQGVDIDDPRYLRILEKAGELGLTVMAHAGEDIGFPGVVRCSPEMIERALRQAGAVRIICAHMGGWRNWDSVVDCLADQPNVMLDTAFSLGCFTPLGPQDYSPEQTRMLDGQSFAALVRAFGAGRVLFGSDSPWADPSDVIDMIRKAPLTEAEKEDILGKNAARLLAL